MTAIALIKFQSLSKIHALNLNVLLCRMIIFPCLSHCIDFFHFFLNLITKQVTPLTPPDEAQSTVTATNLFRTLITSVNQTNTGFSHMNYNSLLNFH